MELCDRLHDLKSELEALQNEPASPRHRGMHVQCICVHMLVCACVCMRTWLRVCVCMCVRVCVCEVKVSKACTAQYLFTIEGVSRKCAILGFPFSEWLVLVGVYKQWNGLLEWWNGKVFYIQIST